MDPQTSTPVPQDQPAAPTAVAGVNPGHGMGVAGLVCAFLAPLVGLILSIVAMMKSKKAGMSNGLALAGIIVSSINMVVGTIILLALIGGAATLVEKCNDLGPGTHVVDGVTYTCS